MIVSCVLCPILVLLTCLSCYVALHLHMCVCMCVCVCVYVCVCVCVCICVCVCVYISRARSNEARRSTASVFRRHEQHKRRLYDQRVRDVEMASFTPLVFAASGGFGPSARVTFKRLASRLAAKLAMPYSAVMGWLRCRVSFSLLRSAVMCLRGSRQHVRGDVGCPALAIAEGHF